MPKEAITTEVRGHVLCMAINRPGKRNAFSVEMYRELGRAYGRLESEKKLRCGLLYAEGDHFTAGLDLAEWATSLGKGAFPELPEGAVDPLGIYSEKLLNKPVVMAVQGICLTIGIELLPDLLPLMQSKDVQEGIAAFVERREARFKGE